jgi:hypothetical protein
LNRNILWGDALDFTNPETKKPIVFSEWSLAKDHCMMSRSDYMFKFLVEKTAQLSFLNDEGADISIDVPVKKDFPLVHYLCLNQDFQDKRIDKMPRLFDDFDADNNPVNHKIL